MNDYRFTCQFRFESVRREILHFKDALGNQSITQVAILAAFRFKHPTPEQQHQGIVVATTHLKAGYEFEEMRGAQARVLVAAVQKFNETFQWPVVVAGDMNSEPNGLARPKFIEAGYRSGMLKILAP